MMMPHNPAGAHTGTQLFMQGGKPVKKRPGFEGGGTAKKTQKRHK